jgi:hypothetical protein
MMSTRLLILLEAGRVDGVPKKDECCVMVSDAFKLKLDLCRANYTWKIFFHRPVKQFTGKSSYLLHMSTTSKIVIGVGLASGALLAAWLLTGTRKEKTKKIISKGTERLKQTLKAEDQKRISDDSEVHFYV